MINAILNLIIKLIFFIIKLIFSIVLAVFPDFTITAQVANIINAFFGLFENAAAFTYFVVGPLTSTFIGTILVLLVVKRVVLPIINFTRKIVIK